MSGVEVRGVHGKGKVKAAGGVATASPPGECRPSEAFPGSLQSPHHAHQSFQSVEEAGEVREGGLGYSSGRLLISRFLLRGSPESMTAQGCRAAKSPLPLHVLWS